MDNTARLELTELLATMDPERRILLASDLIFREFRGAERWPAMNSAHEGFAVLMEEVDELWEHVKTNQSKRDLPAMTREAVQVAAMALRFVVDVCRPDVVVK